MCVFTSFDTSDMLTSFTVLIVYFEPLLTSSTYKAFGAMVGKP